MEALQSGVGVPARRMAPGVVAMTAWTLLAFNAGALVAPLLRLGLPSQAALWAVLAVFAPSAVLAHRSYVRARKALAADPALSGAWYVENAWWLLVVASVAIGLLTFAIAFASAGWLP